jgi:ricin-type beta-trefoil lectin protein
MTNFTAKAARRSVVFGCAVTLGLGALAAAAPAQAQTLTPGTVARSQPAALSAHPLGSFEAISVAAGFATFEEVNWESGLCLGLAGGSSAPGTDAVLWNCNGHPDQQWSIRSTTTNSLGFKFDQFESNDGALCLGVAGGSTAEGAKLVGWTCDGTDHEDQWWRVQPVGCGDQYNDAFQNLKDGWVMGTQGGNLTEGTDVVQWKTQGLCNNQVWYGLGT